MTKNTVQFFRQRLKSVHPLKSSLSDSLAPTATSFNTSHSSKVLKQESENWRAIVVISHFQMKGKIHLQAYILHVSDDPGYFVISFLPLRLLF